MRTTIILDELHIGQIKPDPAYDTYFRLLRLDLASLLADNKATFLNRPCPGCGTADVPEQFKKEGLSFHDCPSCYTLFVSPVPSQEALDNLTKNGRSVPFRRELFAHTLAAQRAEHLHQNIIQWIMATCDEQEVTTHSYCEVGSDDEVWNQAVEKEIQFSEKTIVSPLAPPKGNGRVHFVPSLNDAPGPFSAISCFSAVDKSSDPVSLLAAMAERLAPGGMLFLTTSTASGLEYQLLGRDAPSFRALDRLTMFSVEALRARLESHGLNIVEMSTPGRLDVEAVATYLEANPSHRSLPFWSYLFNRRDENTLAELQLFLQRNLLSSYVRVAARKPA